MILKECPRNFLLKLGSGKDLQPASSLEHLLLVHNQIKLITDMKEIKLKTLDLSHNLLVSVPQISSSLTQLNLRNNNISQVGAKEVVRSLKK